jgi:hypothetical protein
MRLYCIIHTYLNALTTIIVRSGKREISYRRETIENEIGVMKLKNKELPIVIRRWKSQ